MERRLAPFYSSGSVDLYFSQHFDVDAGLVEAYGALDISVVSDLPLFIDPFLLFNSERSEYRELHNEILRYLVFLRDLANEHDLDDAMINDRYCFREVKQNWFGYTLFGNDGSGLGEEFAVALHGALSDILSGFGNETVTRGTHLEKLCLVRPGVGRDNISDFTTNLIKGFLCEYTESFAREHLADDRCQDFSVARATFNYETRTWATKQFYLPQLRDDFVLLTPRDMLTRDETWISPSDMIRKFYLLPPSIPNSQLRGRINQYFRRTLGSDPDAKRTREAVHMTIARFPELIDRYIKLQEDEGDRAEALSAEKVEDTRRVLIEQLTQAVAALEETTEFYKKPWSTYEECLDRANYFKSYVEDSDGYILLNRDGRPFSSEKEVQLMFGLVWCNTEFDINREPNNGRGPVDFKASFGAGDKSLIEFKLGSNRQLKRNLEKQVAIYEAANKTRTSVKVIIFYTVEDGARVSRILRELRLEDDEAIVLVDARNDNKPSASKA